MKALVCHYRLTFADKGHESYNRKWVEDLLTNDGSNYYGIIHKWDFVSEPSHQPDGLVSCEVELKLNKHLCDRKEKAFESVNYLFGTREFDGLINKQLLGTGTVSV